MANRHYTGLFTSTVAALCMISSVARADKMPAPTGEAAETASLQAIQKCALEIVQEAKPYIIEPHVINDSDNEHVDVQLRGYIYPLEPNQWRIPVKISLGANELFKVITETKSDAGTWIESRQRNTINTGYMQGQGKGAISYPSEELLLRNKLNYCITFGMTPLAAFRNIDPS